MTDGGDEAKVVSNKLIRSPWESIRNRQFPEKLQVLPQINSNNPLNKRGVEVCYLDKLSGESRPVTAFFSKSCLNRAK